MLAYFAPVILSALILSIGFSAGVRVFRLEKSWRWILAYPIGMTLVGITVYFLWLLGIPWSLILIFLTSMSVLTSYDIFRAARTRGKRLFRLCLQQLSRTLNRLEPLETLLLAVITFSGVLTIAWHFFLQPVVWDALVLYDFRARAIADGWQIEQFFQQFRFGNMHLYDFLHPFLSSLWQALAVSFGAQTTTFLYLGLIVSVLAHAAKALPSRKSWLVFATLLLASPLLLTVWTQNYAVEPYLLLWIHLILLAVGDVGDRPRTSSALILLFLIGTLLTRVSEPYWLVFLLWWSWPVIRSSRPVAEKLLLLALFWLPVLATFAHWWQLQEEAKTWVPTNAPLPVSSYDLARYTKVWENLFTKEFWMNWFPGVTVSNPLQPFFLIALWSFAVQGKKALTSRAFWLFLLFSGMITAAYSVDSASGWGTWQIRAELWARTGLPFIAVAIISTAQRIPLPSSNLQTKSLDTRFGK